MLSIQFVQDRISWHEKLGIYVLQCERRGNGHGSRRRTSVIRRFYINLVVRLAQCPGERMIIWTYAAIEFRIVNKRRHARTKSRASVPAARATSLAKHSSPRPQTAHHEKKTIRCTQKLSRYMVFLKRERWENRNVQVIIVVS